jgi:hypothetical protein
MPKPKVETVLKEEAGWRTLQVTVSERGVEKQAVYTVPMTYAVFGDMVTGADGGKGSAATLLNTLFGADEDREDTEESEQDLILRLFNVSVDRKARADVYEALAQESTMIATSDGQVDIMTFPIKGLIRGINGARDQLATRLIPDELAAAKLPAEAQAAYLDKARKAAEKANRFGPWKTAAKKLIEKGQAKEGPDGLLVAA